MDGEHSKCFVCHLSIRSIVNDRDDWGTRRKKASRSRLENQLDVIFILRNVLKVPRILLVHQLRQFGGNPEDWIRLCDQCIQLTDKARELHQEIKRIETQLKKIEEDVVEKITSSLTDDDKVGEEAYFVTSAEFRRKIRSFVKMQRVNYDDNDHDDDFLEGDKLANYLASQHNSSTAQFLMVEKPADVEMDEIKSEVKSPPPSPSSSPAMSTAGDEDQFALSSSEDDDDKEEEEEEMEDGAVNITVNKEQELGEPEVDPLLSLPPIPLSPSEDNELVTISSSDDDSIKITGEVKSTKAGAGGHSSNPFKCLHCAKQFPDEASKKYHISLVHDQRVQNKGLLICTENKTIKKHVNLISINCPLCEKSFAGNHGKNLHMLTSHKDDPVTLKLQEETGIALNKCPLGCRQFYLTINDLDKHFNWKHPGVDRNKIGKGKSRITKDGKLECGICGKIYEMPKLWSDHQWKQHSAEEIPCPVEDCGGVFPGKGGDEFATHFKRVHRKKNKSKDKMDLPVNCEICGVEKSCKETLNEHRRTVHKVGANGRPLGKKKLQILVNGKSVEVEVANKVKKVEEPVICSLCGKKFSCNSSLKGHVTFVHDKQFSLTCHVCGEGVRNKMCLNYHLLAKHEEDPVSKQLEEEEGFKLCRCEVVGCSAAFLRKEQMDKHLEKMHKGGGGGGDGDDEVEKKFKCKYCGKGFWMGPRLKRHERIHEGEGREDFKCELCGKGFGTKHYLRYHELRTHKLSKKLKKTSDL